jgi:hypothetical protein
MAEKLDVEEMRDTFHRVSAYREVCNAVRASAGHTLFNGVFFLGLTGLFYYLAGPQPIFLVYGAIGVGEILVGLWKKVKPSAEGVLADGLLQFGFAASIGVREFLRFQDGRAPSTISVIIALWCLFDAVRTFQHYAALRRAFTERPTSEHIAYVEDLVREIRQSDPETDPTALDLPTYPHLKAKLLGDLAIFVDARGGAAFAVARRAVEIEREESGSGRLPVALLRIEGEDYPEFGLTPANWRNYAQWKTEGGDPPPPVKVRPVRERPSDD